MPWFSKDQLQSIVAGLSGAHRIGSTPIEGVEDGQGQPATSVWTQIAAIAARAVPLPSKPDRAGIIKASKDVADPTAIELSEKGAANGLATLDSGSKVPLSQIPDTLVGALDYQGVWNADTNIPALQSLSKSKGDYWKVSVAGLTGYDGITDWKVGDWIVYNGATFDKIDNTDSVSSVDGRSGAVNLSDRYVSASHAGSGGGAHANATADTAGFQSAADKAKLDGIAAGGGSPDATESVKGLVELATEAEVQAGTAGLLVATVERLKAEITRRLTPEAWHAVGAAGEPPFQNSWSNFGSGFEAAAFRKDPSGAVRLRGSVRSGTLSTAAFFLPAAYRPPADLVYATAGASAASLGRVIVRAAGGVEVQAGANTFVSLDGVVFAT